MANSTPSHAGAGGAPGGDFAGRVVLVTGAGGGIGRICARLLADAGASLVVAARNRESAEHCATDLGATGADVVAVYGDVGVHGVAEGHVNCALRRYGRLDALVNLAGFFHRESALSHDHDRFDEVLRTNLNGAFFMARAAAQAMSGGGTIVLISSMWAERGGTGRVAYCAAKAGVEALTSVLSGEWSPRNISVYCIAPGWVATEKNLEMISSGKIEMAKLEAVAPGRALLDPIDVARLCLMLAGGGHPMLSGTVIRLDGGLSRWIAGV